MKKLLLFFQILIGTSVLAQPTIFHFGSGFDNINDVTRTLDGTIWLATNNGIARKAAGANTLQFVTSTAATHVRSNGTDIWAMGANFIGKYDGTTFVNYFSTSLLPVASAYDDLTVMANGNAWVLHQGLVYRFVGNVCSIVTPPVSAISSITSKNNTLYLGTDNASEVGVMFDGNNWTTIPANTQATGILGNGNLSMGVDGNNAIYAESRGGIYKYENGQWSSVIALPVSATRRMVFTGEEGIVLRNNSFTRFNGNVVDTFSMDYASGNPTAIKVFGASNRLFVAATRNGQAFLGEMIPALMNRGVETAHLNANLFDATFLASGEMGNTPIGFEPTNFDGVSALFHQNLWIKLEQNGVEKIAANPYRQNGADYYSGPVANVYDSAYLYRYNRAWSVTKAEIAAHKANYNSSGYTAPHGIATWPGNGVVANGEAQFLAPFADYNFNGIYEPYLGEHPEIRGDAAVYTIFNDARGPKTGTSSAVSGVEIHCMAYAFDSAQVPASQNALFTTYKIINRTSTAMDAITAGTLMDFDLGFNAANDLVGSDSIAEVFYCYSGVVNDFPPPGGFGPKAPAFVGALLNRPLAGVMYSQSNSGPLAGATTAPQIKNNLEFKWRDGSPLRLTTPSGPANAGNGQGHAPNSTEPITSWAYNEAANWYNDPAKAEDIRLLPVANIGSLLPQQEACLDFVVVHGRDLANPANDLLASLVVAKSNLSAVKTMYNNLGYDCLGAAMSTDAAAAVKQSLRWYPNPAKAGGLLILEGLQDIKTAVLTNLLGQTIGLTHQKESENRTTLQLPQNLTAGLYAITVVTASGQAQTFKVVVE